jgi:hypothetical protein
MIHGADIIRKSPVPVGLLSEESSEVGCPFIRHIFLIRIMNIFDLLFEYTNNIRIFILLNKLPKLGRNNRISELGLICTQKGQQINKLDFSMFLVFFGKICLKVYIFYGLFK